MLTDHTYTPSRLRNASGVLLDSCLLCGKTFRAHQETPRIVIFWADREYRFSSLAEANRARFFPEVTR